MNKQNKYNFCRIVGLATMVALAPVCGAQQTSTVDPLAAYEESLRINANMPGGKFTVNTVDMRIKIANGYFTWSRTYDGNGWRFSPHLSPLRFDGKLMVLGMGSGSGGGSGGGGGTSVATPMPPAPVPESFGYVGSFVVYEPDPNLVSVPLASLDRIIRNGAEFEAVEKSNLFQQTGTTSGRYFIESISIPGREGVFYRWQDRAGEWLIYDVKGWIDSYGNANGLTATMEYEDGPAINGRKGKRLKAVKDRNGNVVLTFVYDQAHPTAVREVREVLLPGENFTPRVVKYDYDFSHEASGARLLTSVTDAAGNPTSFGYDEMYRLTSTTDGEGHTSHIAYQGKSSRRVKEVAADGAETTFEYSYDKTKKLYTVRSTLPPTAAGRRILEEIYDSDGRRIRQEINGQFAGSVKDDERELISVDSAGRTTRTTRNEYEMVTRIDSPDSTSVSMEYSPSNLRITKQVDAAGVISNYEYDEKGNLVKYVQASGTSSERVTTYVNDANGLPLSVTTHGRTESTGTVTPDAVWHFTYDSRGSVRTAVDPEGFSKQYMVRPDETVAEFVDARNNKTLFDFDGVGRPLAVRAPLGQTTTFGYDKAGNLITQTDPLGRTTRLTYDTNGRLVQRIDAKEGIVKYEYDNAGEKTRAVDADGRAAVFEYDNLDRLVKVVDGIGNATEYRYQRTAQSDPSSNVVAGINWLPIEIVSPTFTTNLELDAADRVVRTIAKFDTQDGIKEIVKKQEYDRRGLLNRTIQGNSFTGYSYDAFAQPIELTDHLSKVTKFVRDARGNSIQLEDAERRVTKFEYDRNGRLVKEVLPLGQSKLVHYDEVGNVKSIIDQNGSRTDYVYDELNRLIQSISARPDGEKSATTQFFWNLDNTLASYRETDHFRNLVNDATFAYDELGRKAGATVTYPNGYKLSYEYGYSAAGLKTNLTWPDGTLITYRYSQHSVLENVTIPSEGNLQFSAYKVDAPTETVFPGGLRRQQRYDGLLGLEVLSATVDQQTTLNLAYAFDSRRRPISENKTDIVDGKVSAKARSFEFDATDRLIKVKTDNGGLFGAMSQAFDYDGLSNRIWDSSTSGSWTYDANDRLLRKGRDLSAVRFEYDDAGNLVKKIEADGAFTTYSYDARNRLIAVLGANAELIARYGYDSLNRRVWREQFRAKDLSRLPKAKRTLYLYADEGLIAEAEQEIVLGGDGATTDVNSPAIVSQYGPRPGSEFTTGALFMKTRGSDGNPIFAYFHHNGVGAPIQAFDKQSNLVWSADYDAFGRATITSPPPTADRVTIENNLRLPGQIEDAETGLHYNWHRYYDPDLGRYITNDPAGLIGGQNRYTYVFGNPLNNIDPMGLWCVSQRVLDAIAGGVGGAVGGFAGGGGPWGAIAGGILGAAGSYLTSGDSSGSNPGGISAAGAGSGFGGAITGSWAGRIGGAVAGGIGNYMGGDAANTGDFKNAVGGAIGGFIGGVGAGIAESASPYGLNRGGNFIQNAWVGVRGGFVGGLAQDFTAGMISLYFPKRNICRKKDEICRF
ncbi:RHS repeat-associated core domain-containing protein [Pseudoduganella sp. R-34]|uniref:RHS repeat-associated core domain-containing protein n=1 Tax=Pseudoduganella sp. R-34 TaxID=3404062 RepID=UPI003CF8C1B0